MFHTEETILSLIVVQVKKEITVDSRYARMFHGKTHLTPGTYFYNFPVTNISYGRMVNKFKKSYGRNVKFTFAYGGLKDM